jgi:hypothetical protein
VGKEFASEARKIHYQEAPTRTIRGQATSVEFDTKASKWCSCLFSTKTS